jgi:hypothetical protein
MRDRNFEHARWCGGHVGTPDLAGGLPGQVSAMVRNGWMAVVVLPILLQTGCVTRRFTIESDPPGAMVFRNGEQLGPTPVEDYFVYYGIYRFSLVKEGYETLTVEQEIPAPWYEWPGIDFVSENLIPFKIRDVHTFRYQLHPLLPVRHDELLQRATDLRGRGQAVQPPQPQVIPSQSNSPQAAPLVPDSFERLPSPTPFPESPEPGPEGLRDL